jgi:hypothetical protein
MNERLQTIKDYVRFLTFHGELGPAGQEYFWWLVKRVESYENTIKEEIETLKRGGPGTRSQVQQLLEKALEGEE